MSTTIAKSTYEFLKELKKNNNREWFLEHKPTYQEENERVVSFADAVLSEMNRYDTIETPSGKKSVYRIYRDVRFSKDKTPYKTQVSAVVSATGKKPMSLPGVYFELGPADFRVYGGVYSLNTSELQSVRMEIADREREFVRLINDPKFSL